jgi:hypothetical protein
MATYVPNALDATQPTEDKTVESAALEFRTLKVEVVKINTVYGGMAAVTTVANDLNLGALSSILRVAANIAHIQTVGVDIANVNTVAAHVTGIDAIASHMTELDTVAADITSVVTVAANIAAVNSAYQNAVNAAASALAAYNSALAAASAAAAVNLPTGLIGAANKFLQVKDDETGYELVSSVAAPAFFGFKLSTDLSSPNMTYGRDNYNVDDFATWTMSENVTFQIINNNLVMVL